ncbi:hypothetical protein LCGC14_2833500 [marine sediment metagenome]|uniref:Uncharacterized protein n=1 Tax=marine sediment metagenome TaxID=412755 RepID=A0A0F8Z038_9ZZZZ
MQALINRPRETILGLVTAPFVITYQGLKEFVGRAAIPNILGTREGIELVQDKFVELTGEMSIREAAEARRAFTGLLAAAVTGRAAFVGIGGVAATVISRAPKVSRVQALKQAHAIAIRGAGVTSLGVFGALAGEPTEREKNFVMFALASIPLGLTFHAFKAMGRVVPKEATARASEYQRQRAARPFNQETAPVPEVIIRDTRGIPMGEEGEFVRPDVEVGIKNLQVGR